MRYPERLNTPLADGWLRRIARAAKRSDMSVPEWTRSVLRRALQTDERRAAAGTAIPRRPRRATREEVAAHRAK